MTSGEIGTATHPPTLLCLGMGYSARALARRLTAKGFAIAGTARTRAGRDAIQRDGWQGLVFDAPTGSPELAQAVASATHILVSAPPDDAGDPVLAALDSGLAHAPRLTWIGYLSTIGVYGDHAGAWVDETTPPRDPGLRGGRRLAAEARWQDFGGRHGKRVEVFRLPGIYGPGRSAIDQLRQGSARRIVKSGQVFNRIHVEDLAAALERAMAAPSAHTLYNLVDDEPAAADEVVAYAARLLGMSPPPLVRFEEARLTPMAASFYEQSKRVCNRRMKDALGVALLHPSYREGLAAILRDTGIPRG